MPFNRSSTFNHDSSVTSVVVGKSLLQVYFETVGLAAMLSAYDFDFDFCFFFNQCAPFSPNLHVLLACLVHFDELRLFCASLETDSICTTWYFSY